MIKEKLIEFEKKILVEQVRLAYHHNVREASSEQMSSRKPANDKTLKNVGKEDGFPCDDDAMMSQDNDESNTKILDGDEKESESAPAKKPDIEVDNGERSDDEFPCDDDAMGASDEEELAYELLDTSETTGRPPRQKSIIYDGK